MPRQPRLHIPGSYYHVMGRGLERRRIFDALSDKRDFLRRLAVGLERTGCECMAWSLMSNHYHLLIRVNFLPLTKLMASLLGGYAASYNRRHNRVGYVFQNRYKSLLCDADEYFLELVRYIHLNPYQAKMVKSLRALDHYRWAGHSALMGRHANSWQTLDEVLEQFGSRKNTAIKHYRQFIERGIREGLDDLSGGGLIRSNRGWELASDSGSVQNRVGDERILGSGEFVESALQRDDRQWEARSRLSALGWDLETLIQHLCEKYSVLPGQLRGKSRQNTLSIVKSLICYWGTEYLGETGVAIAQRLGMSQPAVSKASQKGQNYCEEQKIDFALEMNVH